MSTDLLTFADDEMTLRLREPYVSAALNKKVHGTLPRGVYRGFRLSTSGTALTVSVQPDATHGDHVAVYANSDGHALTVRKTGGAFNLSLSALAGQTVYVVLRVAYTAPPGTTDTAGVLRTYTAVELAAATDEDYLVVLGRVVVPASGTISASSITPIGRVMAWESVAAEAAKWPQVVKNGGFEAAEDAAVGAYPAQLWEAQTGTGSGTWKTSSSVVLAGGLSMSFVYSGSAATKVLRQPVMVPVSAGQRIRVVLWKRVVQVATGGSAALRCSFVDVDGVALTSATVAIDLSATNGSFVRVEGWVEPPATSAFLKDVALVTTAVTFASNAVAFYVDSVGVWVDPGGVEGDELLRGAQSIAATLLVLQDPDGAASDAQAVMSLTGGDILLDNQTQTGDPPNLVMAGSLSVGQRYDGTAANAQIPRISTLRQPLADEDRTLLFESEGDSSRLRLYQSAVTLTQEREVWEFTVNARWNGTAWAADDTAQSAYVLKLGAEVFEVRTKSTGMGTPWSDSSWTKTLLSADLSGTTVQTALSALTLGANMFGSDTEMGAVRVSAAHLNSTGKQVPLCRFAGGSNANIVTVFLGSPRESVAGSAIEQLSICQNTAFSNSTGQWSQIDAAARSTRLVVLPGGQVRMEWVPAGTSAWYDEDWSDTPTMGRLTLFGTNRRVEIQNGVLVFTSAQTTGTEPSNIGMTGATVANALYAKLVPKAWGVAATLGDGTQTNDPTAMDGVNFATQTWNSDTSLRITFATAMADALYAPNVTNMGGQIAFPRVSARATTHFDVELRDTGGSAVDLRAAAARLAFTVFGRQ